MSKHYKILPGNSFRADDGSIKGPGDTIELADDIAANHIGKVEELPADEQPKPAAPEAAE